MKKFIGKGTLTETQTVQEATTNLLTIRQAQVDRNPLIIAESINSQEIENYIISGRDPVMIQARLNRFNPDNIRVPVSVRTESAVTEEVVFGTNRTNIQGGIELEQLRGIVRPLVDTQPHLFRPGTDNFNRPMFVRIVDR